MGDASELFIIYALYPVILITIALIRTVGVGTDEEPEAEIRQPDLGHTAGHPLSQDPGLGLSTCRLSHLTPPPSQQSLFFHLCGPSSGPTFSRASCTCFKREHYPVPVTD